MARTFFQNSNSDSTFEKLGQVKELEEKIRSNVSSVKKPLTARRGFRQGIWGLRSFGRVQSWALAVFLNFFNYKKGNFCIFYQINLTTSGLFK